MRDTCSLLGRVSCTLRQKPFSKELNGYWHPENPSWSTSSKTTPELCLRQKTSHFSTKNHVQTYWRATSSMKTWFNHTQWTWVDELLQGTTCMEYSPLLMLRWLTCSRELVQHPWHGCAFWELKLHADVAMTRWYQHNCFPERWRAKLACVFVACLRGKKRLRVCHRMRFLLNVLVARLASPSAYGVGYVSLQCQAQFVSFCLARHPKSRKAVKALEQPGPLLRQGRLPQSGAPSSDPRGTYNQSEFSRRLPWRYPVSPKAPIIDRRSGSSLMDSDVVFYVMRLTKLLNQIKPIKAMDWPCVFNPKST